MTIQQDVELYASILKASDSVSHTLKPQRSAWIQVAEGDVEVNGIALAAGDGAAVTKETELKLKANTAAELLLFDLPAAA